MPYRILTVPFDPEHGTFRDEELHRFLLDKPVVVSTPEFFRYRGEPYWTVFVEYEMPGGEPEPPVEVDADLDDRQRLLLQRIKEWRKGTAEERGLSAYVICTNRQAAEVARRRPATLEALKSINGFGRKKKVYVFRLPTGLLLLRSTR